MQYISEPMQRSQLRSLAIHLRALLGVTNEIYFPVIVFLEHIIPLVFSDFCYEIVPIEDMPSFKHAETDVIGRIIRIREDVYHGAVNGNGRDRMTIMHEISHYLLMVVCGVKFARAFSDAPVITYRDPEWQAKALAGEMMCPNHLISGMTATEVARKCGVSLQAAKYNLSLCERQGGVT